MTILILKNKWNENLEYLILSLILPFNFMYPTLLKKSILMIFCKKFDNDFYSLADHGIKCS